MAFIRWRDAIDRTLYCFSRIFNLAKVTERTGSYQLRAFLSVAELPGMTNDEKNKARQALMRSTITPEMLQLEPDLKALVASEAAMDILSRCDASAYIRLLGDTVAHNQFDDLETMKADILRLPSKLSSYSKEGMISIVTFILPRYKQMEVDKAAAAKLAEEVKVASAAAQESALGGALVAQEVLPRAPLLRGVPLRGRGLSPRGAPSQGVPVPPPVARSASLRGAPTVQRASSQGESTRGASLAPRGPGVVDGAAAVPTWAAAVRGMDGGPGGSIGVVGGERGRGSSGRKKGGKAM